MLTTVTEITDNHLQVVAEVTPVGLSTISHRYYIVFAAINWFLTFPGTYYLILVFENTLYCTSLTYKNKSF